jgi:hypothetical protein
MDYPFAQKVTLDYAHRPRRRRTLAQRFDFDLWAAVGLVIALLMLDFGCIVAILLRS